MYKILKYFERIIPTINNGASNHPNLETYSRDMIDLLVSSGGNGYSWVGKKIVFDGDSITHNGTIGYPAYVGTKTGCTVVEVGKSGFCLFGDYPNSSHDFRRRVSEYPSDADAIVIMGDVNSSVFIEGNNRGDISDTSKDTWYGRCNLALDAIRKSFPTIPILLVSEYAMGADKTNTSYLVSEAYEELARKHGLIYVDLMKESVLNLRYSSSKYGLTGTDTVHCSHDAMPLFADVIISRLIDLKPCEFTGTDSVSIPSSVSVTVGSTTTINPTLTGDLSVQWTTSDPSKALVLGGIVYGIATGSAIITVKTRSGKTATCAVTVS